MADKYRGVDASIGFESDRPENVGVFVNVTLGQVGLTFSNVSPKLISAVHWIRQSIPINGGSYCTCKSAGNQPFIPF